MRRSILVRSATIIREAKKKPATKNSTKRELVVPRAMNDDSKVQTTTGYGGIDESSWWIPHPRTGIYYPKGHEWVMEGIPEGASSFPKSYWLRSLDGLDKSVLDHDQPFLDI